MQKCGVCNDVKHAIYFCKKEEILNTTNNCISRYSSLNLTRDFARNILTISKLINLEPQPAHTNNGQCNRHNMYLFKTII